MPVKWNGKIVTFLNASDRIEKTGTLENGQPNIIDYTNHDPLLTSMEDRGVGGGAPGTILPNNEPSSRSPKPTDGYRPGGVQDKKSGDVAPGAEHSNPSLPTGGPLDLKPICSLMQESNKEAFNEQDHPRAPKGSPLGGQFVSKEDADFTMPAPMFEEKLQEFDNDTLFRSMIFWNDEDRLKAVDEEEMPEVIDYRNKIREEFQKRIDEGKIPEVVQKDFEKRFGLEKEEETPGPGKKIDLENDRDAMPKPGEDYTDEKGPEGRKKREEFFKESDPLNTRMGEIDWQLQHEMLERNAAKVLRDREEEDSEEWRKYDKVHHDQEKKIDKLRAEREEVKNKLLKMGKLEGKEAQKALFYQKYWEDEANKKHKKGTKAWQKEYDKTFGWKFELDRIRKGDKPDYTDDEWQKKIDKEKKEREELEQQRADKRRKKAKTKIEIGVEAEDRLLKLGLGFDGVTNDYEAASELPRRVEDKLKSEKLSSFQVKSMKDHKRFMEQNKKFNQAMADAYAVTVAAAAIEYGGHTVKYYEDLEKQFRWKAENEINHDVLGVHIYSDAPNKETLDKINRLKNATPFAKKRIEDFQIHKGAGGQFRTKGSGLSRVWGVWRDSEKRVDVYYNSGSEKKKMEKLFPSDMKDFETTADHEFAHAEFDELSHLENLGTSIMSGERKKHAEKISRAFSDFKRTASQTGQNPDFKLHPYTDSYYRRLDDRKETETHSKLREYEIDGQLDDLEKNSNFVVDQQKLLDEKPERLERFNEKYGDIDGYAQSLGFTNYNHANGMSRLIKSYRTLRKSMEGFEF